MSAADEAREAGAAWAPRLRQEARLAGLDAVLAAAPANDDAAAERAALLAALDRRDEAMAGFVAVLRRTPHHLGALTEFGALLVRMGAIDAACRVYAEAIAHHPGEPACYVNLGNLDWRAGRHAEARARFEAALALDPEHAAAHQGLGAVLADLGEDDAAREHFTRGFRGNAVVTLPYRGTRAPTTVLQLIAAGGGNIPTSSFLDDHEFLVSVVVADHLDASAQLPQCQLVFNAIGDADRCGAALAAAARLVPRIDAPVINPPTIIAPTSRTEVADRLGGIAGVVTPKMAQLARSELAGDDAPARLVAEGFSFPLLLRSPGFHTGWNFVRVEAPADLAAAATTLPGDELLAIGFLDARGADGLYRKYRVMFIGGALYPVHLAIARDWKVHYYTSDMADEPAHRAEEAAFLDGMEAVLGPRACAALARIRDTLALDYGGIDFGLSPTGELLLFEANATMVLMPPPEADHFAYRRGAITRALDAVTAMIRARARPR